MSLKLQCGNCQKRYLLSDKFAASEVDCRNCGQAITVKPGVRKSVAKHPAPTRLACPACADSVLTERTLKNGVAVDSCTSCRGTWLDAGEFLQLTRNKEVATQDLLSLSWGAVKSERHCPHCQTSMSEAVFLGDETTIEFCQECDGLWFDDRELKDSLRFLKIKTVAVEDVGDEAAVRLTDEMAKEESPDTSEPDLGQSGRHVLVWSLAVVVSVILVSLSFFVNLPGWTHQLWILLAVAVPAYLAFDRVSGFRLAGIERADAREMVVFVESAYPLETEFGSESGFLLWGRTVTHGYEIRTTEFGHSQVTSEVYHKLLSNRRVLVIASTVHGFKIHKVIRTARHGEDF